MLIKDVRARKIKDSRNDWTIEVSVNGLKASSPSGKSTGKYESKPYYKNLDFCVKFLNSWNDKIEIERFEDLKKVEKIIKRKLGLRDVKKFGGNSLFAFESAILKALANYNDKELWQIIPGKKKIPVPVGNAVGGGMHSSGFDNHPIFQEFLIIPKGKKINENIKIMDKIYKKIGKKIKSKRRNDEGAWQTSLSEAEILTALGSYSDKIRIGLDVAASGFYKKGKYKYKYEFADRVEQINYINEISRMFNVFYLEDPLQEEDFIGFSKLTGAMSIGDDLIATQISRLKKAIKLKSVKGMIIKPNQNGSLLEVKEIFEICKKNKIKTVISHRSGETLDSALGDYAIGFGADYIKTGIYGKVRKAKLNRLIEISPNI